MTSDVIKKTTFVKGSLNHIFGNDISLFYPIQITHNSIILDKQTQYYGKN